MQVEEKMVGATGFEPVTTRTPSVCATRLRYAPTGLLNKRDSNTPLGLKQFTRNPFGPEDSWTEQVLRPSEPLAIRQEIH